MGRRKNLQLSIPNALSIIKEKKFTYKNSISEKIYQRQSVNI